jgi:shikimate dehydrogenase
LQRRAAVLGSPIAHSRSPRLHRAAYQTLGLPWRYEAIEVRAGELSSFLEGCGPEWVGFSLTMPLKDEAWALADQRDVVAEQTRCANTLIRNEHGWSAANTDVEGLVTAVTVLLQDRPVTDKALAVEPASLATAVVIGSGATARSAAAAAAALGVQAVHVCARNQETAQAVLEVATACGIRQATTGPLTQAADVVGNADLVVSTLPGSAAGEIIKQVTHRAGSGSSGQGILVDVAYDPWPSALAQAWQPAPAISGLDMLLWQAVAQVELMTGRRPAVEPMWMAVHETP